MTWYLRPIPPSLWDQPHRHVVERHRDRALRRADEPRHGPGDLDVWETRQQLLEHHPDLPAREVGTEAEVHPAAAERQVRVRAAMDVEAVGVRERARVAVRGREP